MSRILDDREKQFEAQYKHDEELRFKVRVRRAKLAGLWAATEFGLKGAEAEAYAKSVVDTQLEKSGDEPVIEKLLADFKTRGIDMSAHRIGKHLEQCDEEARKQVMSEIK